jgi:SEC-C motif-containing protein
MSCPCGSGAELQACCGRFLSRKELPSTAEQLMRSRYTAYVLRDIDYLVDTHDPETREPELRDSAESWARQSKFQTLRVIATERGGQGDPEGIVEFVATFLSGTRPAGERSRKVGRNDPCSCGSGKKHKKCCGAA